MISKEDPPKLELPKLPSFSNLKSKTTSWADEDSEEYSSDFDSDSDSDSDSNYDTNYKYKPMWIWENNNQKIPEWAKKRLPKWVLNEHPQWINERIQEYHERLNSFRSELQDWVVKDFINKVQDDDEEENTECELPYWAFKEYLQSRNKYQGYYKRLMSDSETETDVDNTYDSEENYDADIVL